MHCTQGNLFSASEVNLLDCDAEKNVASMSSAFISVNGCCPVYDVRAYLIDVAN